MSTDGYIGLFAHEFINGILTHQVRIVKRLSATTLLMQYASFLDGSWNRCGSVEQSRFMSSDFRIYLNAEDMNEAYQKWSDSGEGKAALDKSKRLSEHINDCGFSMRCEHILTKAGVRTLGDLCKYSAAELLCLKCFGMTSLREVNKTLSERDLSLRDGAVP